MTQQCYYARGVKTIKEGEIYDTATIICKGGGGGGRKRSGGWENGQGGALYDPIIKRSPTKGRRHLYMESSTGTFHRDCVLASFHECRRHALF